MKFLNEININGDKVVTSEEINNIQKEINNKIALNKTTLGYQKKNLFKNTMPSQTINGIVFTCNSDGTVKVNGTATANASLYIDFKIPYGKKVRLTGCPSGGSNSTYALLLINSDFSQYVTDTGDGVNFNLLDSSKSSGRLRIDIMSGVTVTNLIFKPMVRYADITDDIYEPYVDDVDTRITENKRDIVINQSTLGYQIKNLIKNITYTTRTVDGVTFNVNSDNTITINGTSTSRYCDFYIYGWYNSTSTVLSKTGDYTISMGDNFANSGIVAYIIVNGTWAVKEFTTSSTNYTITDNTSTHITCLMIRVPEGVTVNNITVYPMIRYSFITDNTYEPYVDDINTRIIENKSDIKINETTLGYTKKNLLSYPSPSYKKWVGSRIFTWDSDGYMTSTDANTTQDDRLWRHGNANRSIYLEAGTYIYSVHVKTTPTIGHNFVYIVDENDTPIVQIHSSANGERIFTLTESKTLYLIEKVNDGSVAFMIRYADIMDGTYEPYIPSINEKFNDYLPLSGGTINGNITANNLKDSILLYSGAPATPNATITIDGLFTNYSVISIIAIVGDFTAEDSYRSATVSLSSIKTQSMTSDDFNIKYVDDNNINIFSGMYSGAPSYVSLKIYAIR